MLALLGMHFATKFNAQQIPIKLQYLIVYSPNSR
jgi:hypothetical protein